MQATLNLIRNFFKSFSKRIIGKPFSHCSFCGAKYIQDVWPRYCTYCKQFVWKNPLPVVVIELEINYYPEHRSPGLLVILRKNEPHIGEWAFPGGYMEVGETWQEAAARELEEETQIKMRPDQFVIVNILSALKSNSNLLLFCRARLNVSQLPIKEFLPNSEVSAIKFVDNEIPLAFPLHSQMMQEYFKYNKLYKTK